MKSQSIKTRIVMIIVVVILITTALTTTVRVMEIHNQNMQNVAERLESNVTMTDLVFMKFFEGAWSKLNILYALPQVQAAVRGEGNLAELSGVLWALFEGITPLGEITIGGNVIEYGVFASLLVFDSNFDLIYSATNFPIAPGFNARNTPFTENVRQAPLGNAWLSNVVYSPVSGLMQVWITRPIMEGNTFLGMVGIPVHAAGLGLYLETIAYQTGFYFTAIADIFGLVAYSNRPGYTNVNLVELGFAPSIAQLPQDQMFEYTSSVTGNRDLAHLHIAPENSWIVISGIDRTSRLATIGQVVLGVLPFVVGLIVAGIVLFLFILQVLNPLGLLADTLKDIATGDADLTRRLEEKGGGEIAAASRYFNQTMEQFRKIIAQIRKQASELSDIGSNLASNMTQTASSMNEIAANIQSIKGRVLNQSASVTQTNSTMEQVTNNINRLSGQVERQTDAVSQSSSAIEEMLSNIQSVTATLVKNATNVRELQGSAEEGKTSLQEVAEDIKEIARESEGLLEINSVMEGIASQTNLLSMNAAIEAAQAGDAGKGFAVVADEIRKLAVSSSEQSNTIAVVLKKIKDSIDKITLSTEKVMQKFESINNGIKIVTEQEEVIRHAMEEQSKGSKQILLASGQVSEITQQVKDGSIEMLDGSREVIAESKNLEMSTQEITNGMNEMAAGAQQVNQAVNTVNELSGRNRENIDSLTRAISQFKV